IARCWYLRCVAASGKPHASASGGKMWPWQSTTSKSRFMVLSGAVVGIETVAQTVAENVAGKDEERDGDARSDDQVRRHFQEFASAGEHRAPLGRRRLHAEPEEAERGADQHRLAGEKAR